MKILNKATGGKWRVTRTKNLVTCHSSLVTGFTLVEIAICLAIIGFALIAIVGVLPRGLDVQRENRERTVINQDATIFMEAIRNGAQGADDLTNYVYRVEVDTNVFTFPLFSSGRDIIGLLTTTNSINHANVRSISGPAVEKPPQDNDLIVSDSFSYRMLCEIVPVPTADPNSAYGKQLAGNLHELRLTFYWPILPNGSLPARPFHQTFRTLIAGDILRDGSNTHPTTIQKLYFFQNQSFVKEP